MAENTEQNYANHAKFDPPFHFFLAPIFFANFIVHCVTLYRHPSYASGWTLVIALALLVFVFKMRLYSVKVQDRVIRLEMRLRLAQVLPERLRPRIGELSVPQLVALRFASDDELPALAEKALNGNLKNKEIKQAITHWRPDFFRV